MNIIFNSIDIEGFMSIGNIHIDLNDSGYTLISGVNQDQVDFAKSNGSGKSSIWEALMWCLTGTTIRGSKNVENINQNTGVVVKLDFSVDNSNYILIRSKNHTKYKTNLLIYVDNKDVSGKGIRDSEKILKQYLPELDNNLLSSVIILGQGLPSRFTDNTPAGRKEILEQLSKSDFMIEDVKVRITKRKQVLDSKLREYQDEKLKIDSEINLAQSQISKDKEQLENLSDTELTRKELDKLNQRYAELLNSSKINLSELDIVKEKIDTNNSNIQNEIERKNNLINQVNQKYYDSMTDLRVKQSELLKDIVSLEKEISQLKSVKDICPTCGQKLPNVFKPDVTEKQTALDNLYTIKEDVQLDLSKLSESLQNELDKATKDCNIKINELDEIKAALRNEYDKLSFNVNNYNKEIETTKNLIDSYNIQISSYETSRKLLEDRISTNKILIDDCSFKLKDIDDNLRDVESHIEIIKKFDTIVKRDFRGYLLQGVIEYIRSVAKQYCKEVFNTELLDFVLEGNNISISYNNKEYEMLSGGEKQKVDLIVQFSIRDMLCKYLNFSCNILVLDEIFDALDSIGCENVINMISNRLLELNSIYIISHHADELDIPADNYITVIKDMNGVSRLKQ